MKLNIYGRYRVEILRQQEKWQVFYLGEGGLKRPARDIVIPADLNEQELIPYLDDLLHESATPDNSEIIRES